MTIDQRFGSKRKLGPFLASGPPSRSVRYAAFAASSLLAGPPTPVYLKRLSLVLILSLGSLTAATSRPPLVASDESIVIRIQALEHLAWSFPFVARDLSIFVRVHGARIATATGCRVSVFRTILFHFLVSNI